jgi:hypothetical protein
MNQTTNKKVNKADKNKQVKKLVLLGVGLTATGIAGYFGWQFYKKSKDKANQKPTSFTPPADPIPEYKPSNTNYNEPNSNTTKSNQGNSTYQNTKDIIDNVNTIYNTIPKSKKEFPLKRGSKGDKVRQLQNALIAQHGASILPKYGADGDFGTELGNALKKLGYPSKITESLFNVITSSNGANTNSLAKQLIQALSKHDFPKTISLLKQIQTVNEYTSISEEFKTMRVNGGVRQTLVNGALNAFLDSKQKQSIRLEFLRMGLKFDGKKWTLSGLNGTIPTVVKTIRGTRVWLNSETSMTVPPNVILGRALAEKLDYTLFENKGHHFIVPTKDIFKHK